MSCTVAACLAFRLLGAGAPEPPPPPPPAPATSSVAIAKPYRVRAKVRRHHFNFILEGGGGGRLVQGGDHGGAGFGRLSLGAAHLLGRTYFSEGVFYEISNLSFATFGLHYNIMFPSRLFLDLGPSVDVEGRLGGHAGIGWALLGVEAQYRQGPDRLPTAMILVKLTAVYFILFHNARVPKKGGDMGRFS